MGWITCADTDGNLFAYSRRPDCSWRHVTTINAGGGGAIGALAFSPNGVGLFVAISGGRLAVWDCHALMHIPDAISLFTVMGTE